MISLTVVGALQAVGIILAIAFLIAPGATAFLVTRASAPCWPWRWQSRPFLPWPASI
jgi:ABC-type Mn2+/Zn2+ transport system permease subunit